MSFHDKNAIEVANLFGTDINDGLSYSAFNKNISLYGKNVLSKKKKKGIFSKIIDSLKEPMILILAFGFILALGTNLGKYFKSGEGDFVECAGILFAIFLSVSITLFMEGSSEKAFNALNKIYDNAKIRVIRQGQTVVVRQSDVVVGDVVFLESGDKIIADGRLISSQSLSVDESTLTGESNAVDKCAELVLKEKTTLAERNNCVFSGTFVVSGNGKMIVTAVGDKTEIGGIASALTDKDTENSPLQQKLNKLGKTISIIGAIVSIIVFLISVIKLYLTNGLTFGGVQSLFVSCIVLIVAAVPEGLPTIVAVSLALNMIKLAKENALIKKMTATETAGAISVICTDKTGTITENKMKVVEVCTSGFCSSFESSFSETLYQNFICNSTAEIQFNGKKVVFNGNPTECALIEAYVKSSKNNDYCSYRKSFEVVDREPFSSDKKTMSTTIKYKDTKRTLIKGAPEKILNKCNLSREQIEYIREQITARQKKAKRVLCFAHYDSEENVEKVEYVYDGFVAIEDPIRKEVFDAVKYCKKAGIKIKMLTGDNKTTALSIAKKLKLVVDESEVIDADALENLTDIQLSKTLKKVSVISRSTPNLKLKIVNALKSSGEIVAVTGDGINDAPAIKHADVGIAMGVSGSEIAKEAADVVLLDDSFMTVVKAISFGRNVYKNLQRFILFQLTVNLSALLFITVCALLGGEAPFNTFQLLWINIIMDGPPALTLGLEKANKKLMNLNPIKKSSGIVSFGMFMRILVGAIVIGVAMILQYTYNFLNVPNEQQKSVLFTIFILFQLFNAFNCRELGVESIFKSIGKNKVMVITFACVFLLHFFIVQVGYQIFGILPMTINSWIKAISLSSLIIIGSELAKLVLRIIKKR